MIYYLNILVLWYFIYLLTFNKIKESIIIVMYIM